MVKSVGPPKSLVGIRSVATCEENKDLSKCCCPGSVGLVGPMRTLAASKKCQPSRRYFLSTITPFAQFHGAGMYYKRHEQFNANNFFNNFNGLSRPINRFNTYSYNVGGPVFIPGKFNRTRDKLFFFWNHEYVPSKTASAVQRVTMPSALERAGDFSQSVDVNARLIPIIDPASRQPLPGNVVPASRLDANGVAALKFFPLPNFLDTVVSRRQYNYLNQWGGANPLQLFNLKPDWYISSTDIVSVSLNAQFSSNDTPNGAQMKAQFPVFGSVTKSKGGMVSIRHRHIFSPTVINEAMVGYAFTFGPPSWTDEGIKGLQRATYGFTAGSLTPANNPLNPMPEMNFGGVVGAPSLSYDGRFPFNGARNVYNVSDNLSFMSSIPTRRPAPGLSRRSTRAASIGSYRTPGRFTVSLRSTSVCASAGSNPSGTSPINSLASFPPATIRLNASSSFAPR